MGEWYEQRVPNWTEEYATLMLRRLERNLFPWIGSKPIVKLTAADVLDCLQRIHKRGALETAHRARASCSEVMRYAVATAEPSATRFSIALPVNLQQIFRTFVDNSSVGPRAAAS